MQSDSEGPSEDPAVANTRKRLDLYRSNLAKLEADRRALIEIADLIRKVPDEVARQGLLRELRQVVEVTRSADEEWRKTGRRGLAVLGTLAMAGMLSFLYGFVADGGPRIAPIVVGAAAALGALVIQLVHDRNRRATRRRALLGPVDETARS